MNRDYIPQPIDTREISLPPELKPLLEAMAKNVHEIWSKNRIDEGWRYGEERNDTLKLHPCLVPYEELPESEKEYDRATSRETLKFILKSGFEIRRKYKNNEEKIKIPQSVIEQICKGNYVLVLGSDIMLDSSNERERDEKIKKAKGDSHIYFLNEVIDKMENDESGITFKTKPETFTELFYRKISPNDVRRDIADIISEEESNLNSKDLNPDLLRLLQTKCFRLVLTTTFDPWVEKLMDAVWGKNNYRIKNIWSESDLGESDNRDDEYFDIQPTLYYVFGKAIPEVSEVKYVLEDNDLLETISRWMRFGTDTRLKSYLDKKRILVLGCNLKDWAFRFFWYAIRCHKNGNNTLNDGDIAVLLQADICEQDRNLKNYLANSLRIRVQSDSRLYVKELANALNEIEIAKKAVQSSQTGGIFISYATEDFAIALRLFKKLKEAGFVVWMDNSKLYVSEEYIRRIRNAINQCRIFIPLLTDTVRHDLESGNHNRYYRTEWREATGKNDDRLYFPVVVPDYDYRKSYHQELPEQIRDVTVFNWKNEPISKLIDKISEKTNH